MSIVRFLGVVLAMTVAVNTAQAQEATRIVCIGDSITQGRAGKGDHVPTQSWRYPLWMQCVDAKAPVTFVGTMTTGFEGSPVYASHAGKEFPNNHEGRWGWTTRAVADKLVETSPQWTADIAIIFLGTNDKGKEESLEPTLAAMRDIVGLLRARNVQVHVAIGLPFQEWAPFPALSAGYVKLAEELSTDASPVITVATAQGWVSKPDADGTKTVDWVHPNPQGDAHIAKAVFTAIAPWLNAAH